MGEKERWKRERKTGKRDNDIENYCRVITQVSNCIYSIYYATDLLVILNCVFRMYLNMLVGFHELKVCAKGVSISK